MSVRSKISFAAARPSPARQRGTVLVMVIGVLALLAIIGVAYVTIGRADRATSTSLAASQRIQDQSAEVASYLAGVVGVDTFSVKAEQQVTGQPTRWQRETFDYPSTDPELVSQLPSGGTYSTPSPYRFNPAGTILQPLASSAAGPDTRQLSDPFLASHRAMRFVNDTTMPTPDLNNTYTTATLRANADWQHISNFAPDGRFVNLANLRGNFNARSGFGRYADPVTGRNENSISDNLTLLNRTTGQPYASTGASIAYDGRRVVVGNESGTTISEYRPSLWSTWQLGMFRAATDVQRDPGDINYFPNQWADADGDGMFDSRWFELVDAYIPGAPESLIPRSGRIRYFVAARAVDLTGLVNVNTATDGVYEPGYVPDTSFASPAPTLAASKYYPWGLSASEIDLRRLLMMTDVYYEFGTAGGYNTIPQPPGAGDPANYAQYQQQVVNNGNAARAGTAAYAAIRAVLDKGTRFNVNDSVGSTGVNAPVLTEKPNRTTTGTQSLTPLDANAKTDFFRLAGIDSFGVSDPRTPGEAYTVGAPNVVAARARFGMETEYELRARNGINDSDTQSLLEQATGGRADRNAPLRNFDPLRSSRPTYLELQGRPDTSTTGTATSDAALWQAAADRRSLLTAVNGARPLASRVVEATATDPNPWAVLVDTDLRTDFVKLRGQLAPLVSVGGTGELQPGPQTDTTAKTEAIRSIFNAYLNALAPYRDVDLPRYANAWNTGTTFFDPNRMDSATARSRANPLSYGATSVELAARFAAFMTANTADAIDVDGDGDLHEPTNLVLTLDSNPDGFPADVADTTQKFITGGVEVSVLTKSDPMLARDWPPADRNTTDGPKAQRTVIHGIEAQPFLVEAAYFALFTDAPDSADGASNDQFTQPPGPPVAATPVTIEWQVDARNGDFICEIIAFQLTNPFDVEVSLTDSTGSARFYIEHAGRTFALTKLSDDGQTIGGEVIALKARETRTFFSMNPAGLDQVEARIRNALRDPAYVVDFAAIVDQRFGTNSLMIPVVNRDDFTLFDGRTGQQFFAGANMDPVELFDPATMDTGVVKVWRRDLTGTGATGQALYDTDILVDRLRLPGGASGPSFKSLHDSLDGSASENISSSMSGGDPGSFTSPAPTQAVVGHDNIGFSATIWRAANRPPDSAFDTGGGPGLAGRGLLPPWCVERKDNDLSARASMNSLHGKDDFNSLDQGDFDGSENAFPNLVSMIDALRGNSADLNDQLAKKAEERDRGANIDNPASNVWDYTQSPARSVQANYVQMAPQIAQVGRSGNYMLFSRAGDLLLPLAIGPSYEPGVIAVIEASGGALPQADRDELGRFTLSEAVAMAADLYSPGAAYDGTVMALYRNIARQDVSITNPDNRPHPVLVRGQLVLEDFVPFIDQGTNGVFDAGTDEHLGAGIPMALNILHEFRTADYRQAAEIAGVPAVGAGGSTIERVSGVVNINTAPLDVLRVIPGLSPDPDRSTANPPWTKLPVTSAISGQSFQGLYDPTANAQTFDIAATLASYRDKTDVVTRPASPTDARLLVQFGELNADLPDRDAWTARADRTQIKGIRETPGIQSEGELAALIIRDTRGGSATMPTPDLSNSIDSLGRDGAELPWAGLSSMLIKRNPTDDDRAQRVAPSASDTLDQRLALVNAAINSVSVRSDVFCVWFKLIGFTPEDVQVDSDADPMIPSVQRRFVMIVDRSGVNAVGRAPKILLFKEVPVD